MRTILIATDSLALPNTLPTTVGIVEKKPPLEAPLMSTNTTSGPRLSDAGQRASMLTDVSTSDTNSTLTDPSRSQAMPEKMRPTAEARLKPATRPAPVAEERPSAVV